MVNISLFKDRKVHKSNDKLSYQVSNTVLFSSSGIEDNYDRKLGEGPDS